MSIFGITILALLVGIIVGAIVMLCVYMPSCHCDIQPWMWLLGVCIGLAVWIGGTLIGVGINTEYERGYVNRYKVQKETIEMSLECEELSGWERVELVNKAVDLNGEFAERKTQYDRWDYVCYDNSLYDGLDIINLK